MSIEYKKNYEQADNIRNELAEKNVVFVDHKKKTTWVKQEIVNAE